MSALARLNDASTGQLILVNPDHVRTVAAVSGSTLITFSDGTFLRVTDALNVVEGALSAGRT